MTMIQQRTLNGFILKFPTSSEMFGTNLQSSIWLSLTVVTTKGKNPFSTHVKTLNDREGTDGIAMEKTLLTFKME